MGRHCTHSLQRMGTQGSVKARPAGVPDVQQAGTADPRGETYPVDGGGGKQMTAMADVHPQNSML